MDFDEHVAAIHRREFRRKLPTMLLEVALVLAVVGVLVAAALS